MNEIDRLDRYIVRELAHLIVGTLNNGGSRDETRDYDPVLLQHTTLVGCKRFNDRIRRITNSPDATDERIWVSLEREIASAEFDSDGPTIGLRHALHLDESSRGMKKGRLRPLVNAALGRPPSNAIRLREYAKRELAHRPYVGPAIETLMLSLLSHVARASTRLSDAAVMDAAAILEERRSRPTSVPPAQDRDEPAAVPYWKAHWGPERRMFTVEGGGAPYAVFNSITDNPNIGDERNFVGIRPLTRPEVPNSWGKEVWANPGNRFVVRAYVSNAGWDNNGVVSAGWLHGVRARLGLTYDKDETSLYGVLSADNAVAVWDGITLHHRAGTRVLFEPGTGKLENNAHPDGGLPLADELTTDGVPLGFEKLDGIIRPGYHFDGYVTVLLRVNGISATATSL